MRLALLLLVGTLAGCGQSPAPTNQAAPAPAAAVVAMPDPQLQAEREAARLKIAGRECKSRGALAKQIMQIRQTDAPMHEVMDIVTKNGGPASGAQLVIAAYELPSFQTEKHQLRAVAEFENAAYLSCVKEVAGQL
jgi:hypothetical protein